MQGRQGSGEERRVGKPHDIARFEFYGFGGWDVLKSGRTKQECRLREPYAGQMLDQVVSREGREAGSAH